MLNTAHGPIWDNNFPKKETTYVIVMSMKMPRSAVEYATGQ